jgi:hypothetical protein
MICGEVGDKEKNYVLLQGKSQPHLSEEGDLLPVDWKAPLAKHILYEWFFGRLEKLSCFSNL